MERKKVGVFRYFSILNNIERHCIVVVMVELFIQKNLKLYHMLLSADKGKQVWRNDIDLRNPNFAIMPALNFTTNDLSCAIESASRRTR